MLDSGPSPEEPPPPPSLHHPGVGGGGLKSNGSEIEDTEFVLVNLSDIRKEMQCPICLGIIRKTRTVMECLHRFCRDCIDKSMRLGNNECPACRTHCASRRSLRDDPNYDALISALYPDIDKYEKEEMALHEEDRRRNEQIQATISETFRRQADAIAKRRTKMKATAAAIVRKAQGKFRIVRDRSKRDREKSTDLEDEDDLLSKPEFEMSFLDEEVPRERRWKRHKKKKTEPGTNDGQDLLKSEKPRPPTEDGRAGTVRGRAKASPRAVVGAKHLIRWARAGARSNMRFANAIRNGRHLKCIRATLLLDSLTRSDSQEIEDEFAVHFSLQPLDQRDGKCELPSLERPHLCCPPNVTVQHICKFLATCLSPPPSGELELLVERLSCTMEPDPQNKVSQRPVRFTKVKEWSYKTEMPKVLEVLHPQATLAGILRYRWTFQENLVMKYRCKVQP